MHMLSDADMGSNAWYQRGLAATMLLSGSPIGMLIWGRRQRNLWRPTSRPSDRPRRLLDPLHKLGSFWTGIARVRVSACAARALPGAFWRSVRAGEAPRLPFQSRGGCLVCAQLGVTSTRMVLSRLTKLEELIFVCCGKIRE
jgi:hypothetical protein